METFVLGDIWKHGVEQRTIIHSCTAILFFILSPCAAVQTTEHGSYDDNDTKRNCYLFTTYVFIALLFIIVYLLYTL